MPFSRCWFWNFSCDWPNFVHLDIFFLQTWKGKKLIIHLYLTLVGKLLYIFSKKDFSWKKINAWKWKPSDILTRSKKAFRPVTRILPSQCLLNVRYLQYTLLPNLLQMVILFYSLANFFIDNTISEKLYIFL